jgi:ABC-type lipoprotein release transport system permease subunit
MAAGVIAAGVGSLIPAVAAARVKPVETLQYE